MAPKEILRYTTRSVTKKTRSAKELEDNLNTRRSEASDTTRADGEIVNKALERDDVQSRGQRDVRRRRFVGVRDGERRRRAAQRIRKHQEGIPRERPAQRTGIPAAAPHGGGSHRSQESEETTFHEIQNPNDELAVTYLFYELQRTYGISERLHSLTPVILVANAVPAPTRDR